MKATAEIAQVCTFVIQRDSIFDCSLSIVFTVGVSNILSVFPGCSPSCGPNAFCQGRGEFAFCDCRAGYLGDGYNCSGKFLIILGTRSRSLYRSIS